MGRWRLEVGGDGDWSLEVTGMERLRRAGWKGGT